MNVSIVIPAYNAAATLAETLQSVCSQSLTAWEAVVVNDGSTDDTGAIARRFADGDPRIRVVDQRNGGEATARNTGVRLAQHPWLVFLDSDDWIAPRHLEIMTGRLGDDPALDAVHCRYARVAADGTVTLETYRPPAGDLFPTLARRAAFPVHACMVRRALVHDVGLFDPALRTSADWDLWQRIARGGAQFGAVDDMLAFYRMSKKGRSLDGRQLLADGLHILRRGQMADARVPRPHPAYVNGTTDPIHTQQYYLLAWCAGLLLGQGGDPALLFALCSRERFPALYPPAIGQCLFESVPLPSCLPPRAWATLAPALAGPIERFLTDLERRSGAMGLASAAAESLRARVAEVAGAAPALS